MDEVAKHRVARHAVLLALQTQVQKERAEISDVSAGSRRRERLRELQGEGKRGDAMSRVGPIERELSRRCFEAHKKAVAAENRGDKAQADYWRGAAEAYADSSRYAEGLED